MTAPTGDAKDDGRSGVVPEAPASLRHLANWGTGYLERRGVPNARNNAEWILCDAAGCDRLRVYIDGASTVSPDQQGRYLANIRRRGAREPLQYILEATEFMSLPFRTPRGVFVPRPDTETLVETSEAMLRRMPLSPCLKVLDLCCGSGVIAVSLASRVPNLEAWSVDSSASAVAATATNAVAAGLDGRVRALTATADRFLSEVPDVGRAATGIRVPARFSAVVCNPPYVATPDLPDLPPEVRDHEPLEALDGGGDGMEFYRAIGPLLAPRIEPGGFVAFEIGAGQGPAVSAILGKAGFVECSVVKDHSGLDRVVTGSLPA